MPLKCILDSGFDIIEGNFGIEELDEFFSFFGDEFPWNLIPGCISLLKDLDRYSWLRKETGVGEISNILF